MNKLKPCPFCGKTPVGVVDQKFWRVVCQACGAKCGAYLSQSAAESAWNRRTSEPEQTEAQRDLEELRETLVEFPGPGIPVYPSLYRIVIRLAEKAEMGGMTP